MQRVFMYLKAQEEIFPPQNPIQNWPLASIELNVCPQDFLSCSGLLCSSGLNEMQRGSENSSFIFAVNKGSVLWEFGGLRLLGIKRFQGTALKLLTAPLDYFCRNSCSLEAFERVSSHLGTFQRNIYVHDLTWKTVLRHRDGFQWGSARLVLVSMKHKELVTGQGDSDPHLVLDASRILALHPPIQPHNHISSSAQNSEFFCFVQFSACTGHGCYLLHFTLR